MQPKSNTWNVVLFFVLSALTILGWVFLQRWLQPPPPPYVPPSREELALSKVPDKDKPGLLSEIVAMLAVPAPVPGVGLVAQLSADAAIAQYAAVHDFKPPALVKAEPKPPPPPKSPPKPLEPKPPGKRTYVELGGEGYKLQVKLTSRGAGVARVVLVHFRGADRMGLPEDGPLELVPESINEDDPSNLLFHYAHVNDDRPLPTLGTAEWTLEKNERGKDRAVFSTDLPELDLRLTKIYTLKPDEYHVGLEVKIQRLHPGKEPLKFRYQLTSGHGLPIEGEWYTNVYRNAVVGLQGERNNFYRKLEDSRTISRQEGGSAVDKSDKELIRYAGIAVQYFAALVVVDPRDRPDNFLEHARPTPEGPRNVQKPYLDDIVMRVRTQPLDIQETLAQHYLLYYGPVKVQLLGDLASRANGQGVPQEVLDFYINDLHLNTLTDYGTFGFWTQLLIIITNVMHTIMDKLHVVIPSYGICIILVTFLVRGLMHPISRKQAQTSIKMQALMPELKKLQAKHKGDRQAMAADQMALYRKHGVHPLGSCWIVFLQMPIFLGLYYSLQESIHFRLSEFLWIRNLAAPDMLIWWTEKIPLVSRPDDQGALILGLFPNIFYLGPYFNLLPVLAVGLMIVQQKFLMPPPTDETQEMQQKVMKYMMIFMGLMFYKVAAGLCIYFIVSSVWGLVERKLLPKAKPAAAGATAADDESTTGRSGSAPKGPKGGPRRGAPKNGQPNGPFTKIKEMWAELLKQAKKK
jgi:YidC/Oxa1 family membrane protein insertase